MVPLVIFAIALFPFLVALAMAIALYAPDIRDGLRRLVCRSPAGGLLALALVVVGGPILFAPTIGWAQGAVVMATPASGPDWLSTVVGLTIAVFVAFLTWAVHRFLGIQLDRKAQDDLHRAALTGAQAVARKLGSTSGFHDTVAPSMVVDYIRASVPAALDRLLPERHNPILASSADKVLGDLAAAKLRDVVGSPRT